GNGGNIKIGATTVAGQLNYVGTGETVTRSVQIFGSTGNATIDASGSGALVLTNLTNGTAGAKGLVLTGISNDNNMVTSTLADNGGALALTKSAAGTWILAPTSNLNT